MFWILICTILALLFLIYDIKENYEKFIVNFRTIGCSIFVLLIGAFFGLVAYVLIGTCIANYFPKEYIPIRQELSTIDDYKKYYLINDRNETIYYNVKNDTIKKSNIDNSNIEIKEESIEKPYLIEYKGKFKKDWYNWFALKSTISEKYEFHIPSKTMLYLESKDS